MGVLLQTISGLTDDEKAALKAPLETMTLHAKVTLNDVRMASRICDRIDQSNGIVELEDADFKHLKAKFQEFNGWNPAPEARPIILSLAGKLGLNA